MLHRLFKALNVEGYLVCAWLVLLQNIYFLIRKKSTILIADVTVIKQYTVECDKAGNNVRFN